MSDKEASIAIKEHDATFGVKKVSLFGDGGNNTLVRMGTGLNLPGWDYCSRALSGGDTTETFTFKTGGSGGTTVATVVVVYTDSTRVDISSVTKT